jgi:hypothetical protein
MVIYPVYFYYTLLITDSVPLSHIGLIVHRRFYFRFIGTDVKRFFWHKYYEATGAFGRRKDGKLRKDKRNVRLDTEADFWMFMALKKAGSTIRIPRRRFLGTSPEVEKAVREIVEENLTEYFTIEYNIIRK